ncbi:hypothetical protein RHSIM_Rhsim07G0056900 [Rhododendron simsii]|uniref:Ferredoxin thioredoxin reductase alpha chain domain-containing protein n=1 Tax=Rhododendron simsii TaxID=118357 RepID=A0A834GP20_RHOSS|nr:hypothetical protein RHSIM_Rhsim07G0056900 [Rhododendron simsii]
MMASPAFLSTAATTSLNPRSINVASPYTASFFSRPRFAGCGDCRKRAFAPPVRASESATTFVADPAAEVSPSGAFSEEDKKAAAAAEKIGARVRVKVPLKVYHVPRVPEVDLTGKEGKLKQYVAVWKGKRISANMPFKVEFVEEVEGRGAVKFFAHLKEDEFEYLD